MNNKPITLTIVALGITIVALLLFGCATNRTELEFEPLPPEKLQDLRFNCDSYAYKSITIKDIIVKEEC